MTWKDFFKPTIATLIVFLIFFFIFSYLFMEYQTILPDAIPEFGGPFGFYSKTDYSYGVKLEKPVFNIKVLSFLIDVFIWYFVSCTLVFLYKVMSHGVKEYNEMKRKSEHKKKNKSKKRRRKK